MPVHIDLQRVANSLRTETVQRGRYALANQAMADMNKFVPMDEGVLRLSASIDVDGGGVNYNTPYANNLFYMYKRNYTTPGTGPRWDLKAKSAFMHTWIEAFAKGANW